MSDSQLFDPDEVRKCGQGHVILASSGLCTAESTFRNAIRSAGRQADIDELRATGWPT